MTRFAIRATSWTALAFGMVVLSNSGRLVADPEPCFGITNYNTCVAPKPSCEDQFAGKDGNYPDNVRVSICIGLTFASVEAGPWDGVNDAGNATSACGTAPTQTGLRCLPKRTDGEIKQVECAKIYSCAISDPYNTNGKWKCIKGTSVKEKVYKTPYHLARLDCQTPPGTEN